MDPLKGLNSLTENILGDPADALGDPKTFLDTVLEKKYTSATRLDHDLKMKMIAGVAKLVDSVYGKGRVAQQEKSWRCLSCNTINGLQQGSYERIRKTCSKCAKRKTNDLTVKEELLIDFLESEGDTYEEAKRKVVK